MRSNKLWQGAMSVATAVSLLAPSNVLAAELNARVNAGVDVRSKQGLEAKVVTDLKICAMVGVHLDKMTSLLSDMHVRLDALQDEREDKLKEHRDSRQELVKNLEVKIDANWDGSIERLEADAKTDAQKQAVADFRASVEAALKARRTAYANANESFKIALDTDVTTRRTKVKAAVEAFHTAVKAALDKAKADCAGGKMDETVRLQLRASVRAARERFQQELVAINKIGAQAKAAAAARHEADVKAMVQFRTSMERARVELKAAFAADASTGS